MNWDDVSDETLDFTIFEVLNRDTSHNWSVERVWNALGEKRPKFTTSWADMGLIIADNSIDLEWPEHELGGIGQASKYIQGGMDIQFEFTDKQKALRAAAFVFLMMNGVKPEDALGDSND